MRTAPDRHQNLVRGQREHQPAGRGVTGQRGHGELAGVGQDRVHQVVDGIDVPPGFGAGIGGGLDHVQVDAVAEEVPGRPEHDRLDRAGLGVPVGGQQAAALAGAHGPAGEAELQVADLAGLAVADLLVGAPTCRERQRGGDHGYVVEFAAQRCTQRERGGQLEGLRAAGRLAAAQLRDPDRPVRGGPADRAVPPGQDRPGPAAQLVFGVPAVQVELGAADRVQDAGAGVGGAQPGQYRLGSFGRPVDRPVGLAAGRPEGPGDVRSAVI